MKFIEKAYVNKMAYIGHAIICTVLFIAYFLELLSGARSLGYFLIFALLLAAPVIVEFIIYKKNPEAESLKHIMGITYGVVYAFALFTTDSAMVFTYAFPMFIIVTLFSDVRFCVLIAVIATTLNIANVIYYTIGNDSVHMTSQDIKIRICCSILLAAYMTIATVVNNRVNREKMAHINKQKDDSVNLLNHVLSTSDIMISDVEEANKNVSVLGTSVQDIKKAMDEVSTGSNETAQSVQEQLMQTEKIQEHITTVKTASGAISDNMAHTMQIVADGEEKIGSLSKQVERSMEANSQVTTQMNMLSGYLSQMNTIVETITSIAESTSLLALNASIEAARAGEAGRGFSVVAGEITSLANQTTEATESVTKLIDNITDGFKQVEQAVDAVSKSNQQNEQNAEIVKQNFKGIATESEIINQQTKGLSEAVAALETANIEIIDKIQMISAISEEVSAHAGETYDACEENNDLVNKLTEIVERLNSSAKKLHA